MNKDNYFAMQSEILQSDLHFDNQIAIHIQLHDLKPALDFIQQKENKRNEIKRKYEKICN